MTLALAVKGREHSPTKTASKAEPKNEGLGLLGLGSSSASASAAPNLSENIESPRRTHTYGREAEELHISSSNMSTSQQGSREPPRNHSFHTPSEFTSSAAPGISVHQATPQKNPHPTSVASSTLPGPLQSGRPGPPSINTTSSIVPTLPQTPGQPPRQPDFARASSGAQIHGYSRSSPAGLEQKYAPYINTPENSKYASTSSHKYTSQTPKADPSYSPLGLAEIRAHSESAMTDTPSSANPYSNNLPTNCNYLAPWAVYAFDWCKWPVQQQNSSDGAGKMAIGSYVEDGHNFVGLFPFDLTVGVFEGVCLNSVQIQILDTYITPEADVDRTPDAPQFGLDFVKTAEATHSYPVTRILWEPASSQKQSTDLLATSGDHLRLWSLPSQSSYAPNNSITRSSNNGQFPPQKLTPLALLSNSKSPEHTAPLTSLDWNNLSPSLIITSSIDTTCTIWDIPTLTAKTQLIAHDKEVFDVRFCANSVDVFVSCGADGSVRMFDLRSLEHSTIIYEPSEKNDKCEHLRTSLAIPVSDSLLASSPGNISPTTAQQTMSYAPPLLRLAGQSHPFFLLQL